MTMNRIELTKEMTEELERLSESEYVSLARLEKRIMYKERQRLYQLRALEKRGRELAAAGCTRQNMEARLTELEAEWAEAGAE